MAELLRQAGFGRRIKGRI